MIETVFTFFVIGLMIAAILIYPALVKLRRNHLRGRSFPPHWQGVIDKHVPMYPQLSVNERRRLQGHMQVFLAEKQFIGCGGLQVTEEMKLVIAAIACLLLLNHQEDYFPRLRSILIYPSAYVVDEVTATDGYVVEQRVARLGESWTHDQVVLSWQQVKRDTNNWSDGHNVVLHEFAHQLDQADGKAEGVPILRSDSDYVRWSEVMTAEYQQLCMDVQHGINTVMDSYGATNPAEFFAVATETFFAKPRQLLKRHPALYEQLHHYYQLDPIQWMQ